VQQGGHMASLDSCACDRKQRHLAQEGTGQHEVLQSGAAAPRQLRKRIRGQHHPLEHLPPHKELAHFEATLDTNSPRVDAGQKKVRAQGEKETEKQKHCQDGQA